MGACASRPAAARFAALYELDERAVLGRGAFATAFEGRARRSGERVAVKRMDKAALAEDAVVGSFWQDEAAAQQRCSPHANILALLHVYESPTHVFLVTELAPGGELFEALVREGAYSEWDAKRFTRDVLEALVRIHDEQIVHRDIKPENLLLTSKDPKTARIKLGDFGAAMPLGGTSHVSCTQLTWAYCAPELLREMLAAPHDVEPLTAGSSAETCRPKVPNPSASPKSDVWSVGIVLYVLLSGVHPFDPDGRQTKDQIINNVLRGRYSLTEPALWESEISAQAKSLLKLLLHADPAQRPSAKDALAHAWFHDATTPRLALQVSVSKGLGTYQQTMQKKFRTSVRVAMAAQSLRRSLQRIRTSTTNSGSQSGGRLSIEIPRNDDEEMMAQIEAATAAGGESAHIAPLGNGASSAGASVGMRLPTPTSKLFGGAVHPNIDCGLKDDDDDDHKRSEQQSMELIDEFDGDGDGAHATRPPRLVD